MECKGITCPECGCNINLEWKTDEELKRTKCTLGHSTDFACNECSSKHSKESMEVKKQ